MLNKLIASLFVIAACFMAQGATKAEAQSCVSNAFQGLVTGGHGEKRYIFVTHEKDSDYVVYQSTWFERSGDRLISANTDNAGLFSNRFNNAPRSQPFDVHQADARRITLHTDGRLLIENLEAGSSLTLTGATCSGNLIMWSTPTRLYTLTVGPVEFPII